MLLDLCSLLLAALAAQATQLPLASQGHDNSQSYYLESQYYELPYEVKRVAVIGAGPNGLQHAATLLEHGFEVKLFEQAPQPGGIWLYTEKTAIPAPFA